MISYTVESKEYDKLDLPEIVKSTLKKNDGLKDKYIIAVEHQKQEPKEGELLTVYYRDEDHFKVAQITMVSA